MKHAHVFSKNPEFKWGVSKAKIVLHLFQQYFTLHTTPLK